jgi:hypothetical protein
MRYEPGQRVRVAGRDHEGHHRTPGYAKGKVGTVERMHGAFPDPETTAYHGSGEPPRRLYLVRFAQRDVWPGYAGAPTDRLSLDLFEHWLEPAE